MADTEQRGGTDSNSENHSYVQLPQAPAQAKTREPRESLDGPHDDEHRHEGQPLLTGEGDLWGPVDLESSGRAVQHEEDDRNSIDSLPSFSPSSTSSRHTQQQKFFSSPYLSALLFDNQTSEARDLDAAERNFLSWVRLAMVLAVSGTAIMINLRFKEFVPMPPDIKSGGAATATATAIATSPTDTVGTALEKLEAMLNIPTDSHYSKPLGIIFFVLAIVSLLTAMVTYISTCDGYIKQHIVVTNSLSALALVVIIALTIIASNILLIEKNSAFLLQG